MQIEVLKIEDLVFDPANARKHSKKNLDAIIGSLSKFGQQKPIVVDKNNVVVAGNGTLEAAKKIGWSKINCVRTDLTGPEAIAFALADNRTAELAEWDLEPLTKTLQSLKDIEFDLGSIGFDDDFMEAHTPSVENPGLTDPDEVPENVETRCKPGDLWILGNHRLLCGDSTNVQHVERLMGGEKADICFTSPPYALGKSVALSGNKKMAAKANPYGDHIDKPEEWPELMRGWFNASHLAVSDVWIINVQPLASNKRELIKFIFDNSGRLIDIATWDKGHAAPAMAEGVMSSRFEWIVLFGKDEQASRSIPLSSWRGTIQNVYTAPPQRSNEFAKVHAATMPIHLPLWVIGDLCDQSTSIYEPFCGTGTTLIACEKINRKCYGMEIDPHYCDVIIKRWEDFTGNKATLKSE